MTNHQFLEMLQQREKALERELIESRVKATALVSVADARLSEVRSLIDSFYNGARTEQ